MKNITINLIGQSVLEEVLRENLKYINFEIKSFEKFNEIIQDSKVKNSSIFVTSLKDYDLFINSKLNIPVLFFCTPLPLTCLRHFFEKRPRNNLFYEIWRCR